MKDREPWDRVMGSGRIDDYLHYAGDGEEAKNSATEQPKIGAAEMVAMNNAGELSGIGGVETFGMNNLAAIALLQEINGDAAVRDEDRLGR